jgi:hypothetical protein
LQAVERRVLHHACVCRRVRGGVGGTGARDEAGCVWVDDEHALKVVRTHARSEETSDAELLEVSTSLMAVKRGAYLPPQMIAVSPILRPSLRGAPRLGRSNMTVKREMAQRRKSLDAIQTMVAPARAPVKSVLSCIRSFT